jgi:hypothetical protein
VALVSDLTGTGLSLRFQVNALRTQLEAETAAQAREAGALLDPRLAPFARAETRAAGRLAQLERESLGTETGEAGLTAATDEAARAAARQREAVAAQNAAIADAARYGRVQGRAVFGLALLAVAGALLGLAGALGSAWPGRVAVGTAAGSLAAAVAAGASALAF